MNESDLQIKLNNARLYNELKRMKKNAEENLVEKNKVKELVLEYKNALESKNKELEKLQTQYNKIPEFVRNFFDE